jgi:hypothetical protein
VVLLVACWEAFIENLAIASFDWLLGHCPRADAFPGRVRARAAQDLRSDRNELAIWALAGDGWREVLAKHKSETIRTAVGSFNTPKSKTVDALFDGLIGLTRLSAFWRWPAMPAEKARQKLDRLLEVRGNIAHRVRDTQLLRRREIDASVEFVNRLAVASHNA